MREFLVKKLHYQMTSILKGAVERGTAKKLKSLKSSFSWKNRNNK